MGSRMLQRPASADVDRNMIGMRISAEDSSAHVNKHTLRFDFEIIYLEVRYEVGRDTPLRLDPGAARLAVGLDFAILALEHNVEVIQD